MNNEQNYPLLSVIIPVYNGEADLPELIECLKQQTYPCDRVEYLLINNNSSDQTEDVLKRAAAEINKQGISIQPLTENQIQSSYAARNCGIRAAKYDILVFTDADCRPQADWLEKLVKPFQDLSIGIVVGELLALPGDSILEQYAELSNTLSQTFLIKHPFYPYGQTANLAIRKQAFKKVGLFRPYLTTGGDADICWRIQRETDWKLEFSPDAIVRHRHRANIKDFRSQWRRYGCSNRYFHELYGVDLMRDLTTKEIIYRLSRWLIKELPRDSVKLIKGQAKFINLIKTPIDLIGFKARTQGQKTAKLTKEAKIIERL
jgi:cellulose synthase/poly-beta-1,6-N-acetylglucosamine synthase-like glycosyltransferase